MGNQTSVMSEDRIFHSKNGLILPPELSFIDAKCSETLLPAEAHISATCSTSSFRVEELYELHAELLGRCALLSCYSSSTF